MPHSGAEPHQQPPKEQQQQQVKEQKSLNKLSKNQQQQVQQQEQPQQQKQSQQQQQAQEIQPKPHQQQPQQKQKVPPINTYKMELQETIKLCKLAIGTNFTIKRLSRDRHAIHCSTVEQHNIIKSLLKETKTEYFSFTPKVEKLQTVLLKGIDASADPNALLSELQKFDRENLKFIAVKPYNTVRARRESRKLPFFLVQLSAQSKLDSLRSITVLDYQVVTWDKLKRRGDMLQCMRCQRFGHAAANCEMLSRCVKCGENHNKGECKLGEDKVQDRTQLRCILCGGEGHPANYRGCPKFQQIKQQKIARQPVAEKSLPVRPPTTSVNPRISYAQMASGRGSTVQPTPKVDQQASVPKAATVEADMMSVLLAIQGQLTGLQNQIREQAARVDHIYSVLPSLTLKG